VGAAALLGVDASHHLGAVLDGLQGDRRGQAGRRQAGARGGGHARLVGRRVPTAGPLTCCRSTAAGGTCGASRPLQQRPLLPTCSEWKVPFLPVNPCTMTFVLRSTKTAGLWACRRWAGDRAGERAEQQQENQFRTGQTAEQSSPCYMCTVHRLPNVCTGRQAATLGSADHACPLSCCAPPPGNAPLCSAPDCSWAAAHPPLPTAAAHCSRQCMRVARGARQQQRRQVTATLLAAAAAVAAQGGGGGETWSPPCPPERKPKIPGAPTSPVAAPHAWLLRVRAPGLQTGEG
jgi:hypothetical protein